jgi:hypothetical protein
MRNNTDLVFLQTLVGNPPQEREWIPLEDEFNAANSTGKLQERPGASNLAY